MQSSNKERKAIPANYLPILQIIKKKNNNPKLQVWCLCVFLTLYRSEIDPKMNMQTIHKCAA